MLRKEGSFRAIGTKTVIVFEDEGDIPLTDSEITLVTPIIISNKAGIIVNPISVGTIKVETLEIGDAIS